MPEPDTLPPLLSEDDAAMLSAIGAATGREVAGLLVPLLTGIHDELRAIRVALEQRARSEALDVAQRQLAVRVGTAAR